MSSDERQEAIWDIILQRKFETVPNIADELGVCTRTIYGDVTKMRKKYPIEPISGKYGGVYLVHKPHNAAMHLTPLQEITLQELIFFSTHGNPASPPKTSLMHSPESIYKYARCTLTTEYPA